MTTLLDRLREALAPDYEVEREVASGGMGVVFQGRDIALDRRVAIKIVRPDLATAVATERFVREARVLASLSHPNIVPVHRAGESRGFIYYVMDYLEAPTLDERLASGPLPADEVVRLGRDLLAALQAIHARGVVHRDVKPANIFLVEGRAVLGDFGVAKTTGAPALTREGRAVGSPGYMAPEQLAGRDVTPATDLFATALVLYEAVRGTPWPFPSDPARANWAGVPPALVAPLARALAWAPEERWPDAAAFRAALEPAARSYPARRAAPWLAAALAVAAAVLLLRPGEPPRATTLHIHIRPFAVRGPAPPPLGDSLAATLAQSLGGSPDFSVEVDRPGTDHAGPGVVLGGTAEVDGGVLRLAVATDTAEPGAPRPVATTAGPVGAWRDLVADSLGTALLLQIWSFKGGKLAADLPVRALPRTPRGVAAWVAAEQLFARAQWKDAYTAYRTALAVDSTCLMCWVRLADVGRWLGRDLSPEETARYRSRLAVFPRQYRLVIASSFAPGEARWRLLDSATERAADFGFAWFVKGDEIFHRGPLDGFRRRDALAAMQRATMLWPDFAPAWEHLAWIAIGEGDSALASVALDSLAHLSTHPDAFSAGVRTLLDVCFRWRFSPAPAAAAYSLALLRSPAVGELQSLAAGARYLMTCDVPQGAVWLGEAFQHVGRSDLEEPGLLAEIYGDLALGRPAAARDAGVRLRSLGAAPGVELFLDEWPGALLLADADEAEAVRRAWPTLRRPLDARLAGPRADAAEGDRAAWLLALLARRARDTAAARRYRAILGNEPAPHALATLVDADLAASRGRPGGALSATEPLLALDSASRGDPFFRALLHLMRAEWLVASGDTTAAVRELRWHENNNLRVVENVSPAPEPAEGDWSLGTLGRWRRAELLDRLAGNPEACACYEAVGRLWAAGEEPYAARARLARRRYAQLGCGGPS